MVNIVWFLYSKFITLSSSEKMKIG